MDSSETSKSEDDRLLQDIEQTRAALGAARTALVRTLTALVVHHANRGQLSEALVPAREAFQIDPDHPIALKNLRTLLDSLIRHRFQAGNSVEAASLGKELVAIDPDSAEARRMLAICLLPTSKIDAAKAGFSAWRIAPEVGEFFNITRNVFKQTTTVIDRDFVANPDFYKKLARREETYEALIGAGRTWEGDNFEPAAALLRRAITLVPDAPFAYLELASLLGHFGQWDESRWCFERVQRFTGSNRERMIRLDPGFHADLETRPFQFKSPLEGELGVVGDDVRMVVFVSCDPKFFRKYWPSFSDGLMKHIGSNHFHLHIMNPDEAFMTGELLMLRAMPQVSVSFDYIALDRLYEKVASYFASNRLMQIPEILAHYKRPILFLDIDVIIKGSLSEFTVRFEDDDIAVPLTPAAQPGEYVSIDIMVLNHTPRTLKFLRRVARYIDWVWASGRAEWLTDQTGIYCVLFHYRENSRPFLLNGLRDEDFMGCFDQIKASTPR